MDTKATQTMGHQLAHDRLIPQAEAQTVVGVSRSQIYRLLEDDAFPQPVKIGRNNYFSCFELQRWIAARLQSRIGGFVS